MKIVSVCMFLSLALTLASCGSQDKISSKPAAVANACDPASKKPKLYTVEGGAPGLPVGKQYIAGFFDQNCEEKKVYLNACSAQGAKAMLGLLNSTPLVMLNDEWEDFIEEGIGGYWQRPHLSCTSGAKVTPQWEEGHKAEVHIISGKGGTSSLDVASRNDQGQVSRLHYVAFHSCLGLRRQLGAEAYANPLDPNVQKPLQLAPGDDALYLNCAKERPPQESREGWSLVKTLNGGGPVYLARYRPTAESPSQDLVILRADGRDLFQIEDGSSEQKPVEETLLRRLGLDIATPVLLDNWDMGRDHVAYDLCTAADCSTFTPQHQRMVAESLMDFNEAEKNLSLHLLPDGLSLHALKSSSSDPSRLTAFARCPKETDLVGYLGFKRPQEPTDWWTRAETAANTYQSLSYEEFPCLGRRSVCRITIGDEDLSAKASNLYNGISSLMRRPINGACASATELEILVAGKPKVSAQPFKIGNLPESVQKPFTSIRIIGGPQGLMTLDRNCTGCQAISAPALVITGPGRFSVENLAFRSLDEPTAAPSIALQTLGTTAGKPEVAVKGLRIQAATAAGEFSFATGVSVIDSDIHLWSASVASYYQALDAQGSRVSLFGVTAVENTRDIKPMGTSLFKVLGPTTALPYPGTSLQPLNSLRALRLTDSALSIFGTVLDAPFGIDMSGTKAQAFAETRGLFNRFMNSGNSLGTRSSALYLKGYAKVKLSWSEMQDMGGLIEFDAQNFTKSSEGIFENFYTGSTLKRNRKIIVNAERGLSNFEADCRAWDDINKVCVL